jgi:hypothetical protein
MGTPAILPLLFLQFWFYDLPKEVALYFLSLNKAYFHLFSVKMLLQTFFKPIKNEYREGLVRFSICMGMVVKTAILFVSLLLFFPLLVFELVLLVFFVGFPFVVTGLALFSITNR